MKKIHQDVWISLLIFAFCAFFVNESFQLDEGSEVMPLILLSIMAFLGGCIFLSGIRKTFAASADKPVKPFITCASLKVPFAMFLMIAAYVGLFFLCGYYAATAVFLIAGMVFLKQRRVVAIALITVCFLAFTHFFLVEKLNVSIDEFGLLGQWFQMRQSAQMQ